MYYAIPFANRPGSYFYVDKEDYDELFKFTWCIQFDTIRCKETNLNLKDYFYKRYFKIEHLNGNLLDFTKNNLSLIETE